MAEEDGEDNDEEDEDAVEGGAAEGFGYCEGEVCWLSVGALGVGGRCWD